MARRADIATKFSSEILRQLRRLGDDDELEVIVQLADDVDVSETVTPEVAVRRSAKSQVGIIRYLEQERQQHGRVDFQTAPLLNSIYLRSTKRVIEDVARHDEVLYVSPNSTVSLPR